MGKQFEEKKGFEPLPEGDYLVRMNRAKEVETKNGNGKMISAGFEVVSGEQKGRLVFHNFLVEHTNPKASDIGLKQLDFYLKAVNAGGLTGIDNDLTKLDKYIEIPFIASLKIEDEKEYKKADGSTAISKAKNAIVKFMSR